MVGLGLANPNPNPKPNPKNPNPNLLYAAMYSATRARSRGRSVMASYTLGAVGRRPPGRDPPPAAPAAPGRALDGGRFPPWLGLRLGLG